MRLCALLGVTGRTALKRLLTHREYREWLELYQCDPWGDDRGDLRAGIVAAAAIAPYAKKGQTPRPADFMPYARTKPRQQSNEQIRAIATRAAEAWRKRAEREKTKRCRQPS